MKFTQDFARDFDELAQNLLDDQKPPFALVRFGDGEAAILADRPYQTKMDGWRWPGPGGMSEAERRGFRIEQAGVAGGGDAGNVATEQVSHASRVIQDRLAGSAGYDGDDWFMGLPCPNHEPDNHEIVRQFVRVPPARQTYAKILSDDNYRAWKFSVMPRILALPPGKRPVLVGCRHNDRFFGDIEVPRDWMMTFRGDFDDMEIRRVASQIYDMARPGQPVLVAAGPLAKLVILSYWITCPPDRRAKIVDAGSAIDEWCSLRRGRIKTYDMMADHRWRAGAARTK